MAFRTDDITINTILGDGSFVKGDLRINGFVRVDGDVDGDLITDGKIIIGANARIRGNIQAFSVTVGGIVTGDIIATEKIELLETSIVIGDVVAHQVSIEDNVFFQGHCISLSDENDFQKSSEKFLQGKAITQKVKYL